MFPDRAFFERLANAAKAETLPRFRSALDVTDKGGQFYDPVTEGDQRAETAIVSLIEAAYPDHGILGEEHGSKGLDRELVWVIDPIDGTRAFISGVPVWGTLIGLYQNGRARMGLIDQPFIGERWFADGERSHYSGPSGEKLLRTSACETISNAILFTTSPHLFESEQDARRYREVERRARLFRYGCDCYAYALLASGHIDLVVENSLKPYDVGAIIPVVEQAGGVMTTWDGGRPEMGGHIVAAANAKLHAEALEVLNS
jgi:histidinol phosphatase-like enzyme (inositol monophosphatase family)